MVEIIAMSSRQKGEEDGDRARLVDEDQVGDAKGPEVWVIEQTQW